MSLLNQSKQKEQIEIGTLSKHDNGDWAFFNADGSHIIDNAFVIQNNFNKVWQARTDLQFCTLVHSL